MSYLPNVTFIEDQIEKREAWLAGEGRKDSDVMEDDNGEYVIYITEEGKKEKVYLPVELTKEVINNY